MFKSEQGFTMVELLVTMAIISVVLVGAYQSFLSSSKRLVLQNEVVEMQTDGRAAMDFMVRELRLAYPTLTYPTPSISTTVATNDTITFDRLEDAGYSSGGNGTTLQDTTKTWSSGQFDSSYKVWLISGTGAGQAAQSISSNSSTQLTISAPGWSTYPDTSSFYIITRNRAFSRTSTSDNMLRYTVGGSVNNQLAELITSHAFCSASLCPVPPCSTQLCAVLQGSNIIGITLTAQTRDVDRNTGHYRQYTLTDAVLKRN